ncbi:hypothetical protein PG989_009811 [Apiospora arundinis]
MSLAETSVRTETDQKLPGDLETLEDEGVPSGTFSSRLQQLHGIAHPIHRTPDAALQERDRENLDVSPSWPPQHDHSFIELKSPRNKHSDAHAITRDRRRGHNCKLELSECSACGPRVTGLRGSFSIDYLRAQPTSSRSVLDEYAMDGDALNRRKSARELFVQYGVARPSGWLSDEEDLILSGDRNASPRRFCRICHVCSARTWSPSLCSACGHRLCERCMCEVPEDGEEAHVRVSHHPSSSTKEIGTRYSTQPPITTPESRDHRQQSSQALHTETISQSHQQLSTTSRHTVRYDEAWSEKQHQPTAQSSAKTRHGVTVDEVAQGKSVSRDKQSMASLAPERNPLRPQLRADTLRSHPTWSVKQNPFLVADREAKSKGAVAPPAMDNDVNSQSRKGLEVPVRHDIYTGGSNDENEECDNPTCRATHEGHHPFRHSVSCALYRSSQDEDVNTSSRGGIDKLPRKVRGSTSKSYLAERSSLAMEALHSRHDTIHRHHSPGFHGPRHIAEHLALATGRNRRDSHADSTEEHVGQSSQEQAVESLEVTESSKEATDQHHATKQLEPLTQAQATTKVGSFQYKEEPLPHGHPSHEEHRYPSGSAEQVSGNDIPEINPLRHGESGFEAHEVRQRLRHVQRTEDMRDVVGQVRSPPIYDRNILHKTPSRSPLRIVKRMESTMFSSQDNTTNEKELQGINDVHVPSTREAKGQEKSISQTNSQVHTNHLDRSTKHTEQTTHKEIHSSSRTDATSHEKTSSTARGARSEDDGQQSYVSDERIAFNGQKKVVAPKGRVSSPPPWLKTPSKKPANVQDRLRHVETRSHYDLSRAGKEQSKRFHSSSNSIRSQDRSSNASNKESSPKTDYPQSHSEDFQKTVHTQNESETWLGLPSELHHQQGVKGKSSAARPKAANSQEGAPLLNQASSSLHGHESEYSEGCIFCEAPSPTPPHMRGLSEQNAVEAPLSPSILSSSSHALNTTNHPSGSAQHSYRKATLRAQEELDQLRAVAHYSSSQQRTVETREEEEEERPQDVEREVVSDHGARSDDAFSFSSKASNLEIHRPTPIAPPNHDCRWKDRYMALTSEIRQLKAEMSTRVSFHDVDDESARGQGSQQQQQQQQQDEDLGIQGLTIVMHLKGKDDLVINTDLTQDVEEAEE